MHKFTADATKSGRKRRQLDKRLENLKRKYVTPHRPVPPSDESVVNAPQPIVEVYNERVEQETEEEPDLFDALDGVYEEPRVLLPEVPVYSALGIEKSIEGIANECDQDEEKELDRSKKAFSDFVVGLQARREVSQAVVMDIVDYLRKESDSLGKVLSNGVLPSFRQMRRKAIANAPQVLIDVCCMERTGEEFFFHRQKAYPRKAIKEKKLTMIYALYYVSVERTYEWHAACHPSRVNLPRQFDVSIDGVPESKSSGLSIEVLSIRFMGCKNVYTIGILQPSRKGMQNKDSVTMKHFLDELEKSDFEVRFVIADAPKRSSLRGLKSHAANFSCPYCHACKVDGHYPSNTFRQAPRSDSEIRRVAELVENGRVTNSEGVKCRSILNNVKGLDLVNDIPAEPMHLVWLGIVRKMIKLMYKQKTVTTSKYWKSVSFIQSPESSINAELHKCKGLPEHNRRPRDLDTTVWKAEEYRNLVLVFWPAVAATAPSATKTVWLLTVYIVRAFSLPDVFYEKLNRDELETNLLRRWYVAYEAAFKAANCTHNTHLFTHLDRVRKCGPLSETSAMLYEDHYAVVKKNYKAGTAALGSQALTTTYLAQMNGHPCLPRRKLSLASTDKVESRFVYMRDGAVMMLTYLDGDDVRGRRLKTERPPPLLNGLALEDVLVFKVATQQQGMIETVDKRDVLGKVVLSNGYGSVVLWNMMNM